MTDNDSADLSHLIARSAMADTPKMISLNHSTTSIVNFLDFASVSSPTLTTTFDETIGLLALVEDIRAHKLLPQVKMHLYMVMSHEGRAADMLLLASKKDDWTMGRKALRNLSANQAAQISVRREGLQGFFEQLRPVWRRTLIDLIFFATFTKTPTKTPSFKKTPTFSRTKSLTKTSTDTNKPFWDWASLESKFVAPQESAEKRKSE
jgi:hypothetical protein